MPNYTTTPSHVYIIPCEVIAWSKTVNISMALKSCLVHLCKSLSFKYNVFFFTDYSKLCLFHFFCNLIVMYFGIILFSFLLSGVHWVSWMFELIVVFLNQTWKNFSYKFFKHFFVLFLFSLFFRAPRNTYIKDTRIRPSVHWCYVI